ncbi:unnamed protein product [Chrysoparadoxa australica]
MATQPLQQKLEELESRLAQVEASTGLSPTSSKGGVAGFKAPAAASSSSSPFVTAYDEYSTRCLNPFLAVTKTLGGAAETGGEIVGRAWAAQRAFLVMASQCKKPAQDKMGSLLADVSAEIKAANSNVSRDEFENHTKTISEGLGCLSWLAVAPPAGTPKEMIESTVGGSDYWANKIRVVHKKSNPDQIAFCDTFKALITGLLDYAVAHHKAGVEWNPRGGDALAFSGGSAAAPPAPPAPPAMPKPAAAAAPAKGGAAGMASVFGELNKGLNVTKGLNKVTKDQQTWRKEFAGGDAPKPAVKKAAPKVSPKVAPKVKGTPKLEFQVAGNKWIVENQGKEQGVITVEVTDTKHSVYIYGCVDVVIDVKGKCKSIAIDGCKKTKVLLDDAISSVESVNCQRIQVQVRGIVPSVAIDKTDGFLCYIMNPEAMAITSFTTSKSSEMNVQFPDPASAEGEFKEMPIPEQFVHTIKQTGKETSITSDVSDLYGH